MATDMELRKLVVMILGFSVVLAGLWYVGWSLGTAPSASGQTPREFWLSVEPADIEIAPGVVWHAWTYNGTVPGPTLRVRVGDVVRVHLTNNHNLTHSLHVHGLRYTIENDGSQAYPASMPAPGETYTYEFEATRPGLFYYHCHSSDGYMISTHILQGLYGAIIVYQADQWPPDPTYEFVQFFSEVDLNLDGSPDAYLINDRQAFEHDLQDLVETQGYDGAVQTLKSAGFPVVPVGQELTFYMIGIGNLYHSWHLHGGSPVYVNGQIVEGDVIPIGGGTVATAKVTIMNPGIWLIHCHVVVHADLGMVTLIIAE